MALVKIRLFSLALVLSSVAACTKKAEMATVTVRLPSADTSSSAKASATSLAKTNSMMVGPMAAPSPSPSPAPTPFPSQMGWGLDRPTNFAQTKCFAIVVEAPGSNGETKKCTSLDSMNDINASAFAGLSPVGSTIEMNVPVGTGRKFHVFAFAAESAADCATATMGSLMKTSRLSAPARIAMKEVDIVSGNNDLVIQASYDEPIAFDNCEWTRPADLAGGSLSINAGAIATNSTSINVTSSIPFAASEAYYTFDATCSSGGTWQPFAAAQPLTLPAGEGTKTVRAKYRDSQGAVSGCLSASITLDQTAPVLTVNTLVPANILNSNNYSFGGSCSEEGRPVSYGINAGTITGSVTCTAGAWSVTGVSVAALPDGNLAIIPSQIDAAGNVGTSSSLVIKDTVVPNLAITSPLASTYANANQASSFLISGTCSENGQVVSLNSTSAAATGPCTAGTFAIALNVSALSEGSFTVLASLSDIAGNPIANNRIFVKDTVAPTATVSGQPNGITLSNSTSLTIAGTDVVQYQSLTTANITDCNVLGNYTAPVSVGTPLVASTPTAGGYYVCVLGVDLAQNVQPFSNPTIVPIMKGPVTIAFLDHMSIDSEAVTTRNVGVTISPPTVIPFMIDIQTQGSAVFATNYLGFSNGISQFNIPANVSNVNFTVPIIGTSIANTELVMSLSIRGSTLQNGVQLGNSNHQLWISDSGASPLGVNKMAVGTDYACSINSMNKLFCWGNNSIGQLGDGTSTSRLTPVPIDAANNYVTVAAGINTTCAIRTNGNLYCWGANGTGQLGIGSVTNAYAPMFVGPGYTQVSVGLGFACGTNSSNNVYCWGDRTNGRLGDSLTTGYVMIPTFVSSASPALKVSTGWDHACAVKSSGSVVCWGAGTSGQLGNGASSDSATPVAVTGLSSMTDVSNGLQYSCALRSDSKAFCWGSGSSGKLGNSAGSNQSTPVAAQGASSFSSIKAGSDTTCGVDLSDSKLKCWGYAYYGIMGDGLPRSSSFTMIAPKIPAGVLDYGLALNGQTVCASAVGVPYCWGSARGGTLGNGITAVTEWANILPEPAFTKVSLGRGGCGITTTQKLMCWGPNDSDPSGVPSGAVGDGTTLARQGMVYVDPLENYSDVSFGIRHSCGITSSGVLKCWGDGSTGALGAGNLTSSYTPQIVSGGWAKVSVGSMSTCAITTGNLLFCWGYNVNGAVGDGTLTNRTSPVAVMAGTQFNTVSVGAEHACAIATAGSALYCWGYNNNGQVGNASLTTTPAPTMVAGVWTAISAGAQVTCGINSSNLYCWGRNSNGELGQGSTTPAYLNTPTSVGGGFSSVSVGKNTKSNGPGAHVCAINSGSLECWGAGGLGQNGSQGQMTSPTTTDGGFTYTSVVTGELQTCGLLAAGTLRCRGAGEEMQLPLGVSHLLPNLVPRVRF